MYIKELNINEMPFGRSEWMKKQDLFLSEFEMQDKAVLDVLLGFWRFFKFFFFLVTEKIWQEF